MHIDPRRRTVKVAAKLILWAFLIGGALSGYVAVGTLYTQVGTLTPQGGRPAPFNRVNFLDMLLNDAVKRAQQPPPAK